MKKKLFVVLMCSIFVLSTGCGHKAKLKDGKEVVASIKGYDITAEDLFEDLSKQYGTNSVVNLIDDFICTKEIEDNKEAEDYAKSNVAQIKNQYESMGYDFENILVQSGYESEKALIDEYTKGYKKEQVVKKYLKENKITEEEIKKYYDEEVYGDYSAKHILIKSTATSDSSDEEKAEAEEAAKNKAIEVINKLNDGANWSDLVKEYSEDLGSVDSDGLVENFTKGDMVEEFFNAVVALEKDKYTTEPVKSTYGYHVILKISETEKPSLEDKKDSILDTLAENYLDNDSDLYAQTWVEIRKSYDLKINDTSIEKTYNALTTK